MPLRHSLELDTWRVTNITKATYSIADANHISGGLLIGNFLRSKQTRTSEVVSNAKGDDQISEALAARAQMRWRAGARGTR